MVTMNKIIASLNKIGEGELAKELQTIQQERVEAANAMKPLPKDIDRIKAIKAKTKRDYLKAQKLATLMADKITDASKAARRAKASVRVYSGSIAKKLYNIFWKKYLWLKQSEKYS
jgi:acetylglutamate kinase